MHIVFSKSIPHSQSSSAKSCFQARFCSSGAVRASNRSTPFFGGAPRHLTTHSAASSRFISPESPRECSSSALFCEKTTGFPPIPGLIVAGRTIVSGIFPARAAFVKVSSRSCPRRRFSSPPNKLPRKPPPSPADPTQMTCFTFPSRMAAFRMAPGAPQLIARTPLRITRHLRLRSQICYVSGGDIRSEPHAGRLGGQTHSYDGLLGDDKLHDNRFTEGGVCVCHERRAAGAGSPMQSRPRYASARALSGHPRRRGSRPKVGRNAPRLAHPRSSLGRTTCEVSGHLPSHQAFRRTNPSSSPDMRQGTCRASEGDVSGPRAMVANIWAGRDTSRARGQAARGTRVRVNIPREKAIRERLGNEHGRCRRFAGSGYDAQGATRTSLVSD